jgi:predicted GNAT family acetyltransferase
MHIQHKTTDKHGTFYIEQDGDTVAEIVYSQQENGPMVIEHTEVDEQLRGKNIGNELVERAVEYAREKDYKITPVCVFAKAVFDKNEEYKDVLA